MGTPYWEREKCIQILFDYEKTNRIPSEDRLTYDAYASDPKIPNISPRKKAYVDIRRIISRLRDLGLYNKVFMK